jgi:AcrR family transcriptional regulator
MPDDQVTVPKSSSPADASQMQPIARGRGRPVGDREAKRSQLLEAAIAVIAEEGIANTSLRKVAQRAGCTTGAVTYYFANKEAMMVAVVESRFDYYDAVQAAGGAPADLRSGLERWLEITNSDDIGGWITGLQLIAYARNEPALADVYQRRYKTYRERFTSAIERAQARGSIRDDIPADLLADQLSAMGDGWMMMMPVEPERFQPDRVKALLDAVVTLVSPPPTKRKMSPERRPTAK